MGSTLLAPVGEVLVPPRQCLDLSVQQVDVHLHEIVRLDVSIVYAALLIVPPSRRCRANNLLYQQAVVAFLSFAKILTISSMSEIPVVFLMVLSSNAILQRPPQCNDFLEGTRDTSMRWWLWMWRRWIAGA